MWLFLSNKKEKEILPLEQPGWFWRTWCWLKYTRQGKTNTTRSYLYVKSKIQINKPEKTERERHRFENKQVIAGLGERLRGTMYIENKQALRLLCATMGNRVQYFINGVWPSKEWLILLYTWNLHIIMHHCISQKEKKRKNTKFQLQLNESQVWNCGEERVNKNVASLNGDRW